MSEFALTPAERALLAAFHILRVRYLIVGMGAALLEGDYELDGLSLRVLPLARVIVSKRAANRPKDIAQLPILAATLVARETEGQG